MIFWKEVQKKVRQRQKILRKESEKTNWEESVRNEREKVNQKSEKIKCEKQLRDES